MRSAFAYLLFCFYCLISASDNLLPFGRRQAVHNTLIRAMLLVTMSFFFFVSGSIFFYLLLSGITVKQSVWLSVFVGFFFLLAYFAGQYLITKNNRGVLLLENFAPLIQKNKWIYPVTALLVLILSFSIFLIGAANLARR